MLTKAPEFAAEVDHRRPTALQGDLSNLPAALEPLKDRPNWVVWRWEQTQRRDGTTKWTKVPYRPRNPKQTAQTNNDQSWGTYEQALAIYQSRQCDGIGFVLTGTQIAAFDIDDCRDPFTGEIAAEALELVGRAGSYTEITPSGTGIRVVGFGFGPKVHRTQKIAGTSVVVESYRGAGRYITVTGNPHEGAPTRLSDISDVMDRFVAELDAQNATVSLDRSDDRCNRSGLKPLPGSLVDLIDQGPGPEADLSAAFHHAVCLLYENGWSRRQILERIAKRPIVPERYAERLDAEIGRCIGKASKPELAEPELSKAINATPFQWCDPASLPRREWVYGHHLIRKYVSATIALSGLGKSALVLAECVALATGRDLLGITPPQRCRVWYWNGEDPTDETQRRVAAICLHYRIDPAELEGWLFIDSGRETEISLAQATRDGMVVNEQVAQNLVATLQRNNIDLLCIDPFVSSHRVAENDNNAIDLVVKRWAKIADETNCAIELVHHSRKLAGGTAEVTVQDGRGASALLAAVRSARVLNGMTKEEAKSVGEPNHRLLFREENGKLNLAPPPDRSTWYRLKSISIGNRDNPIVDNSDNVGVVTNWEWPDHTAGITGRDFEKVAAIIRKGKWRANPQAKDWAGKAVAQALSIDLSNGHDKAKARHLLKYWIGNGSLREVEQRDDRRREMKTYIEVADHIDE